MMTILTLSLAFYLAAENLTVMDNPSSDQMMKTFLNRLADEALDRANTVRGGLKTPEEIASYQDRMRQFFIEQLGGFPERTPLNAQVVGGESREGYRFEKVLFESRPDFFVSGVMFLPLTAPPYPGVLVPCGHSANGKAYEVYQRACIFLAMNGMAAFIYDPIGQGERYQLLDANGKPEFGSTTEHMLVGVGCILLGTNTAAYRIWDGMRALDYLTSRPDIDPERIGCTGNSGGGTLTSYLMALDPRIQCAAPGCYLTSMRRLLETAGPQDAEQDIYGQIAFGMDHADYLVMRAPKPTLMCCATGDFFDIRGAWDSFREAKRVYSKLGFPERVDLVEANEKHGFTPVLRQGMVRWMRRWLMRVDEPVVEKEFPVLSEEEMRCTPKGQVLLIDGARSVVDINASMEGKFAKARKKLWGARSRKTSLEKVRALAGIRPFAEIPEPEVRNAGAIERDGYSISKLALQTEPGVTVPALEFVPSNAHGDAYLYVHGEGKAADAAPGGLIEKLARQGHVVLAPDLRGFGETASATGNKDWNARFGGGWEDFFRAYLLGKSYVGMRAEDLLACARLLLRDDASRPIHLIAIGEAGPVALHAAALEPGVFASLRLERSLASWADVVKTPPAKNQLLSTVNGALRVYDLPDLLATLPKRYASVTSPLKITP